MNIKCNKDSKKEILWRKEEKSKDFKSKFRRKAKKNLYWRQDLIKREVKSFNNSLAKIKKTEDLNQESKEKQLKWSRKKPSKG